MNKILNRDELIRLIRQKYENNNYSLSDLLGDGFILDMYINGHKGISKLNDKKLMEEFKQEIDPDSIIIIGDNQFEVDMDFDDE